MRALSRYAMERCNKIVALQGMLSRAAFNYTEAIVKKEEQIEIFNKELQ